MREVLVKVRGVRPSPWGNEPHEGRWREALAEEAREQRTSLITQPSQDSRFVVVADFYMRPIRRGSDLDNLLKPLIDTLFAAPGTRGSRHPTGTLFDLADDLVVEIHVRKHQVTDMADEGVVAKISW